jgi:hypothetical protein
VRKLLKIVVAVLVLIVIALVVGWMAIDSIAKTAIERGGTYALGVPTQVNSVSLGLLRGEITIRGLTVGNPEGFKTPHLIKTGTVELAVRPGSLLSDTIQVNRFEIDGLDLNFEQKLGSSNISVIVGNTKKAGGGKAGEAQPSGGKKVKADRVVVRNVVAHVQVLPVGGQASTLDVKVPEIVLTDVGSDGAGGATVSELVRKLVPAILVAVVEKCKGVVPDADLNRLSSDLGKTLEGLGTSARQAGENLQKGAGDAIKKIFGGLKKPNATAPPK